MSKQPSGNDTDQNGWQDGQATGCRDGDRQRDQVGWPLGNECGRDDRDQHAAGHALQHVAHTRTQYAVTQRQIAQDAREVRPRSHQCDGGECGGVDHARASFGALSAAQARPASAPAPTYHAPPGISR